MGLKPHASTEALAFCGVQGRVKCAQGKAASTLRAGRQAAAPHKRLVAVLSRVNDWMDKCVIDLPNTDLRHRDAFP